MIKKYSHLLMSMAALLLLLPLTACNEKAEVINWDKPADHTVLMYLVGDNSLSDLIEGNVKMAQQAMRDSVASGKLNLVVMKDNKKAGDSWPALYWVHGNENHQLDTVYIKRWTKDQNTATPEFLTEVLKTTFTRFNTKMKGLVLGSHASGWVPLTSNIPNAAPRRRAFGIDELPSPSSSIELWDLATAIEQGGFKLDYVLMDCCHMSTVEVAYELRNVTRWMAACPTEDEGDGLPYHKVLTRLSKCKSAQDLPTALDYGIRCYFDTNSRFQTGATITLMDLTYCDALADAYSQLLKSNEERLKAYASAPTADIEPWVNGFQYYGRETAGLYNRYYYFDLASVTDWLRLQNEAAGKQVDMALSQMIISNYYTPEYRGIAITRSCGLAVSLPEVFHLASYNYDWAHHFFPYNDKVLSSAYRVTAWGKKMGY